jgi:hypothetical protein
VLIPLAHRCEHVVGVDISRAMLEECGRACASHGIVNVTLTDEIPDGLFDLVHTVSVIQHIPPREGYRVFERLLSAVAPGGTIVCQLPVSSSPLSRLFYRTINLPVAGNLLNLLRGRPWSYPSMQMNGYRLERLLALLARRGYARSTIAYELAPQAFLPDSAFIVAKLPNV